MNTAPEPDVQFGKGGGEALPPQGEGRGTCSGAHEKHFTRKNHRKTTAQGSHTTMAVNGQGCWGESRDRRKGKLKSG